MEGASPACRRGLCDWPSRHAIGDERLEREGRPRPFTSVVTVVSKVVSRVLRAGTRERERFYFKTLNNVLNNSKTFKFIFYNSLIFPNFGVRTQHKFTIIRERQWEREWEGEREVLNEFGDRFWAVRLILNSHSCWVTAPAQPTKFTLYFGNFCNPKLLQRSQLRATTSYCTDHKEQAIITSLSNLSHERTHTRQEI